MVWKVFAEGDEDDEDDDDEDGEGDEKAPPPASKARGKKARCIILHGHGILQTLGSSMHKCDVLLVLAGGV